MISVEEAHRMVISNCPQAAIELESIKNVQGSTLAEDILADRNFPPFDRVTMDGIAIKYEDFEKGVRTFKITGIAAAGSEQVSIHKSEECVEAMTGAMLPENTDTIIRYEDLEIDGNNVKVTIEGVTKGQNIHYEGEDRKMGDLILSKGKSINPPALAVLATVGKAMVKVYKQPKIAIISSGDELVNVDINPEPHQIRKSNIYSIAGALSKFNCDIDQFHLLDDPDEITSKIKGILEEYDVIILSGGVSKGKFDYIPEALAQLNVQKLFHRVKQRPGKPFWFGKSEKGKMVFALPGNPVSSFMCTNKYVLTWMRWHLGLDEQKVYAELVSDINFKPDLTYFAQVKLEYTSRGKILAHPIEGNGSGDLANLTDADAFMELPLGKNVYEKGEVHRILIY